MVEVSSFFVVHNCSSATFFLYFALLNDTPLSTSFHRWMALKYSLGTTGYYWGASLYI